MGLKDLRLPSAEITVPGSGSFTVRGLSTVELEDLYRKNREEVIEIYQKYIGSEDEPNWAEVIAETVKIAPGLITQVIATAAAQPGEVDDEDLEIVRNFTPGLQIKSLERIGALTFSLETEGKNLLEIVAAFLENLNPLMGVVSTKLADLEVIKNEQQSKAGSGISADK